MKGNWRDVDYTLPAGESLVKAIRDRVMTCHEHKFQVSTVYLGFEANYSGYRRVTAEEVTSGGGLVTWSSGFAVVWLNEFWDDRELPIKKIPVWDLDPEQRAAYDRKLLEYQSRVIHPDQLKIKEN
ncbi:hypothetical protein ST201phi2-1p013 [Pseudomonas phage 201phi2-1]|uniref:Uncharacterized protein n=1 Tax=Pseudomonas phage 201phi2-1 TaxID=198110 RepID=B3FJY9_BP201|nr:hypothetical protein ST201phi2-1p013 [Pseudomonas phage 201phi2-1]ABY62847.1 hypothetical protein 201phi2-1p013 [Pseudomonas phage 201phi2-1]